MSWKKGKELHYHTSISREFSSVIHAQSETRGIGGQSKERYLELPTLSEDKWVREGFHHPTLTHDSPLKN
jgi:hypothetical protein